MEKRRFSVYELLRRTDGRRETSVFGASCKRVSLVVESRTSVFFAEQRAANNFDPTIPSVVEGSTCRKRVPAGMSPNHPKSQHHNGRPNWKNGSEEERRRRPNFWTTRPSCRRNDESCARSCIHRDRNELQRIS